MRYGLVGTDTEVHMYLKGLIDPSKELARIDKAYGKTKKAYDALMKRISFPGYEQKVPKGVQEKNAAEEKKLSEKLKTLDASKVVFQAMIGGDDDGFGDDDLFGDDDGDDEELLAKMAASAQKSKKEKPKARSMIVLEVKPFDADTDLQTLALSIKKLTHEGIQNWGQEHKLQPIAFGIKKLIISLVVFDDLIGVDDITDMLMDKYEDDIQSIDIGAFSKV